jgi:hypothetical protein
MRHFLSLQSVSQLAHRVHPSPTSTLLVALACVPLPIATRSSRTRLPAVPRSRHIARHAQRDRPAASWIPTDDDVQCDHGPRRREARHPRGPVRPKTGRTVTSRSSGAIEGTEVPASVSSLCASCADSSRCARRIPRQLLRGARGHRRGDVHRDRRITASRSPVLFAAIRGDHLRRDQQAGAERLRAAHCPPTPSIGGALRPLG